MRRIMGLSLVVGLMLGLPLAARPVAMGQDNALSPRPVFQASRAATKAGGTDVKESKPKDKADKEKIQGTWKIVGGERDGASLLPFNVKGEDKDVNVVITADKLTIVGPDGTISYKLDPTKKPKAIDLIDAKSKDTRPGIYHLDGDDLKLCYRTGNVKAKDERPKEFNTGPKRDKPSAEGPGLMLLILKREKK